MDRRQVFLVDAFASAPTEGAPTLVTLGDEIGEQRRLADEFATELAVLRVAEGTPERVAVVGGGRTGDDGRERPRDTSRALVAALALAREQGQAECGTTTVSMPAGKREVEIADDGRVWCGFDDPATETVSVGYDALADALGVDVAALRDVGADLPPTRVTGGGDTLAVAVNFLEHVSGAVPDREALAAITDETAVDAVCAYTFDTLEADGTCHVRTFVPDPATWVRAAGPEVPVTPAIAADCVTHLVRTGTVEETTPVVEQGHFADRPARIHVRPDALQVGGRAVTTVDGTALVPDEDGDDIIEA